MRTLKTNTGIKISFAISAILLAISYYYIFTKQDVKYCPPLALPVEIKYIERQLCQDSTLLIALDLAKDFDYYDYIGCRNIYKTYIDVYSSMYSLDKNLIEAIITVESKWCKDACSKKKAVGLMQVKNGSFIPSLNIKEGCRILRHNLNQVNGNVLKALMGYYCGSTKEPVNWYAYKVLRHWFYITYINGGYRVYNG
jgi:soluble lytic murein transglycosylase-like protein